MIEIDGKRIKAAYYGARAVKAVYMGARRVWAAVRSCFGSGRWESSQPWRSSDRWKNV